MSKTENISGGFRGEPKSVQRFIDRALADPKEREAVRRELEKLRHGPRTPSYCPCDDCQSEGLNE